MSAPVFYAAIGSLLQFGDGASPENFTTVANLGDFNGPNMKSDTIDTTVHNNTDRYKQFIASLKDGGEVTVKIYFDPNEPTHNAGSGGMVAFFEDRAKRNMRILLPVSPRVGWTFVGLVTAFGNMETVAGALEANCVIKVSGKPTLTSIP